MNIEFREYLTPNGKSPFGECLAKLRDRTAKAKVIARLDRVARGHFGDYKHVGEGVYELRIHYANGYRIYYGKEGNAIILLLCGGDKATQPQDIKTAINYWNQHRGK
jgi:putative addiction module killer protein